MKNIIELAQSRGSSAKTKAGARKFLLANLAAPHDGLIAIETGRRPYNRNRPPYAVIQFCRPGNGLAAGDARLVSPRAAWRMFGRPEKSRRGAEYLRTALGLPTRQEWVAQQYAAGNIEAAFGQSLSARYQLAQLIRVMDGIGPIHELHDVGKQASTWRDAGTQAFRVAGRVVVLTRREDVTWAKNRHYPSSSTVTRTAHLLRIGWDDVSPAALLRAEIAGESIPSIATLAEKSVQYTARGDWMRRLLVDFVGEAAADEALAIAAVANQLKAAI